MTTLDWRTTENGFRATISYGHERVSGRYDIHIQRRPRYCDRGDWLIYVEETAERGRPILDDSDGFPRYFFGDGAEVKAQMQTWANCQP